jgi:hypothetical protein
MQIITLDQLRAWEPFVPRIAALPAAPQRCILHWTAGSSRANVVDLGAYHYVFDQPDGAVRVGTNPVANNMRQCRDGVQYAAHTGGFNSYSVGFAFAGHFFQNPTSNPLTERQVRTGLGFVALCMYRWNMMRITEDTLFSHMEAWTLHRVKGKQNDTKRDIDHVVFAKHLMPERVGPWMREVARNHMTEIHRLIGTR